MPQTVEALSLSLENALGDALEQSFVRLGELTLVVRAGLRIGELNLRDHPDCRFEQLIDLCGMDYFGYGGGGVWHGARFAAVAHLLSVSSNQRVRVRVFAPTRIAGGGFGGRHLACRQLVRARSLRLVWHRVRWPHDLRRILTDYGFIGHPFRKDFPLSGNVEMRYDPDQHRVIYQPVSIEEREMVPRIIREDS